jgi:hypothetical protein
MNATDAQTPQRPSRRSLMKGAAWAAPTAAVGFAAPAFAASIDCTPQSAAQVQQASQFNGSIANWVQDRSPGSAPAVEFNSSYNGLTNVAVLIADPPAFTESTTALRSPIACLAPGTYTFRFNSRLYNANPRNLRLRADVVNEATGAVIGNTIDYTTTSGAVSSRANDTVTVTVAQRTQVRFRYRWTFTASGSGAGDDVAVSAPTVAKIA